MKLGAFRKERKVLKENFSKNKISEECPDILEQNFREELGLGIGKKYREMQTVEKKIVKLIKL